MSGFRVVLDTCVLVPIVKADLLLTLAGRQAFHPLWSNAILNELSRAVVIANPRMTEERATARIADMNAAFEDALDEGWEPIEDCVSGIPDPDDRHVVAAQSVGTQQQSSPTTPSTSPPRLFEHGGCTLSPPTTSCSIYSI